MNHPNIARAFILAPLIAALAFLGSATGIAGEVSPAGQKLLEFLDAQGVEQHWLAGQHVSWRTGDPDGVVEQGSGPHSHCSAFAASACQKLGVYVLRPPDHPQLDLANGQYDWLREKGAAAGWVQAKDAVDAQRLANLGQIVVAVCKAPEGKHGHIAILRPDPKTDAQIRAEGPAETQAGMENYGATSVKVGFKHHHEAWDQNTILYFAHPATVPPAGK